VVVTNRFGAGSEGVDVELGGKNVTWGTHVMRCYISAELEFCLSSSISIPSLTSFLLYVERDPFSPSLR